MFYVLINEILKNILKMSALSAHFLLQREIKYENFALTLI